MYQGVHRGRGHSQGRHLAVGIAQLIMTRALSRREDGPLSRVRVVDISGSYAGPTATMYMGDLGADVIKVERPGSGDDTRHWGPPFVLGDPGGCVAGGSASMGDDGPAITAGSCSPAKGESAWFLSANRNKRSVCIDISAPEGRAVLLRLLGRADVFVENLNPSKLEQLQLDPGTLRTLYPGLVYCAISGFGLTGPDSDLPGYDMIAQARSGLMSVTGAEGGPPERVSTALSDVVAGMAAVMAVLAALRRRDRTGEGDLVDISLLEADLALMAPRVASYLAGEPEPRPTGATDSVIAVYQRFETADRPIVVAAGNDRLWERLCVAVGLEGLASRPDLASNAGRREKRREIVTALSERFAGKGASQWLERLEAAGVPSAPVQSLSDVLSDPQVIARGAVGELELPGGGTFGAVMQPWRVGIDRAGAAHAGPPALGAHGEAVLEEHGFSAREIAALAGSGAVWIPGTVVAGGDAGDEAGRAGPEDGEQLPS